MTDNVIEGYYIGILPELDPIDGTGGVENNAALQGATYGDLETPFCSGLVNVTLHEDFEDPLYSGQRLITSDDARGPSEEISVDGIRSTLDTSFSVYVEVTCKNGTQVTETDSGSPLRMVAVQDQLGRAFLLPSVHSGTHIKLEAAAIESLKIVRADPLGNSALTSLKAEIPVDASNCFLPGTLIRTPTGEKRIETLRRGDIVQTLDNGPQAVRWIASQRIRTTKKNQPVRIAAGALGPKSPATDLWVSPQHRVLLRSNRLKKRVGSMEAFSAAKHLSLYSGVQTDASYSEVTYYHFLLEHHEVIIANNAFSESFYLGPEALKMLTPSQRLELEKLGILMRGEPIKPMMLARPSLRKRDVDGLFKERPKTPLARLAPSIRAESLPGRFSRPLMDNAA